MALPFQPPQPPMLPPGPGLAPPPMPMAGPPMGGPPMLPPPGGLPLPMGNPLAMIGAPPPLLPQGLDPMAGLADPQVMMALLSLIASDMELQNGPVYPSWYQPAIYKKPEAGKVVERANKDRSLHQLLLRRFERDRDVLRAATVGMFAGDAEQGISPFRDLSLVFDAELIQALLAGVDITWQANARKVDERDEAQDKEDFCHASRERQTERHARMYGTQLEVDEIKNLITYGRLVCRRLCDYDAESDEVPIKADLLDPAQVFPTFAGDKGLETVSHVYTASILDLCSTFASGDDPGGDDILTKLTSPRQDKAGKEIRRSPEDVVEVVEFWDRRWHCVTADTVEILTFEHKYGFVPFVYVLAGKGDAGNVSAPNATITGTRSFVARQEDIASRGQSIVSMTRFTHEQREAIFARLFSELKKSNNPPRTFEQAATVYGDAPEVSNAEGGITMLRAGEEKEVPTPIPPQLNLVPPLMAALNEANQRGLMPASSYGLTQNANESGSAIEGLNESGRDKLTPWLLGLESYHTQCGEMDLRLERDWGHLLGSDGSKGTLYLPRAKPDYRSDPTFTLDPQTLRKVGIKIKAKLTSLRLQNLGPLGNSVMIWKNMGLMEKVEALELRGVRDPAATLRRIEIEDFKDSPEYKKARLLSWMREEGMIEDANVAMQIMMSSQNQGGGGQGGPPQPSSANVPGLSLPGLGMPPGTQGGAPPGGTAPQSQPVPGGRMGPLPGAPPGPGGIPPGGM